MEMETISIVIEDGRTLQEGVPISVASDVGDIVADPNLSDESYDVWNKLFNNLNTTNGNDQLHPASDIEVSAVLTSLHVNVCLFLGIIVLYEFFRRTIPSVYRCNKVVDSSLNLPKNPIPLNWVPSIMRVSWSQVRKLCGMDAYFFLRFVRMVFQVTAVAGLWGTIILWPVYGSGGNNAHSWYHLSMANLINGSWKLWFPTIFLWLLTFYVVFMMNEEYKHYVECRMEFLAKGDSRTHPQQRYTLIVEEIPKNLRSDEGLHEYFSQLFPGKIHSACLVMNVPDVKDLFIRRNRVYSRLHKSLAVKEITGKRPMHKVGRPNKFDIVSNCPPTRKPSTFADDGRLPQPGERVDSISYFTKYLAVLNERVAEFQNEKLQYVRTGDSDREAVSEWISRSLGLSPTKKARSLALSSEEEDGLLISSSPPGVEFSFVGLIRRLGVDFFAGGFLNVHRQLDAVVETVVGTTLSSSGFVTFNDLVSLTCAVRAPLSHDGGSLYVKMAPEPRDIEWENAHINKSWIDGRIWTANVLLGLGAILWSVPVTAVQALANLDKLAQLPYMSWIKNAATGDMAAFLNGYLPVLALLILIAVLPIFFNWIALKYEHRKAYSDVQHSVLSRFFYYQLANVYITVSAGSILDSLAETLDHPSKLFSLLGTSVPTVVGYFVMFLLTKLLAGLPIVMLRVGPLLHRLAAKALCREDIMTQEELDSDYSADQLDFGQEYANQLLVIVIMFTYASISPIILPVGALYFLAALVVYKQQLLLVYSSKFESGGVFFPTACQKTLVGLIAAQVTLIGYSVLRAGFYQPLVLLPLPFYTMAMMIHFKRMYEDPGGQVSLEKAIQLDRLASPVGDFTETTYRQPSLVVKDLKPAAHRRVGKGETDGVAMIIPTEDRSEETEGKVV